VGESVGESFGGSVGESVGESVGRGRECGREFGGSVGESVCKCLGDSVGDSVGERKGEGFRTLPLQSKVVPLPLTAWVGDVPGCCHCFDGNVHLLEIWKSELPKRLCVIGNLLLSIHLRMRRRSHTIRPRSTVTALGFSFASLLSKQK
jgi:hypothetical protein